MSEWNTIWLPYPPSVNKAFRNVAGGGRARTGGYNRWRKEARLEMMAQKAPKLRGPYEIIIEAKRPDNRKRDIDNLIKPVGDALVCAGLVIDDSDCVSVKATWTDYDTRKGVFVRYRAYQAETS